MKNFMYSRLILIFEAENYMTQPVLIISMKKSFCCWNVSSSASAHSRNWSTMFAFFYNLVFWLGFSIAPSFLQVWSKANATLCPPESHSRKSRCISHRHVPLHAGLLPLLLSAASSCAALAPHKPVSQSSACYRAPGLLVSSNMLAVLKGNYLQSLP